VKFVEDKTAGYCWSIVIYSHFQKKALKKCGYQDCPVCQSFCLYGDCRMNCYVILYGHFVLQSVCNSHFLLNRTTITDTLHEDLHACLLASREELTYIVARSRNNFCSRNETIHFVFFYTISHQLDDFQKIFIEHKVF